VRLGSFDVAHVTNRACVICHNTWRLCCASRMSPMPHTKEPHIAPKTDLYRASRNVAPASCVTKLAQRGEDTQDALICRSLPVKVPPIIGLFCRQRPYQHEVSSASSPPCQCRVSQNVAHVSCDTKEPHVTHKTAPYHTQIRPVSCVIKCVTKRICVMCHETWRMRHKKSPCHTQKSPISHPKQTRIVRNKMCHETHVSCVTKEPRVTHKRDPYHPQNRPVSCVVKRDTKHICVMHHETRHICRASRKSTCPALRKEPCHTQKSPISHPKQTRIMRHERCHELRLCHTSRNVAHVSCVTTRSGFQIVPTEFHSRFVPE